MPAASPSPVCIRPAEATDVPAVIDAWVSAFEDDPLMRYFFADHPTGQSNAVAEFFTRLMQVRLALGMPVLVGRVGDSVVGGAMGYSTAEVTWPPAQAAAWDAWVAASPGVAQRFDAYEAISESAVPRVPHFYLGVIGVAPRFRRTGAGRALLEAFSAASVADATSQGVYLETANPASLAFYRKAGFEVSGEGALGDVRLWCVFQRQEKGNPPPA